MSDKQDIYRLVMRKASGELREQINELRSSGLNDTTCQDTRISQCLAEISNLRIEISGHAHETGAHDQRTFNETLRGLKKQFEDVRTEVVPKRKFAFKPKPKPVSSDHSLQLSEPDSSVVSSSQPIRNPSDHLCHESMTSNGGAGSLEHVSVLSNVHHTLRTESHHEYVDRGIVIANSSHCVIKCLVPSPSLAINEVQSSVIVCGPINGAALVTGMTASTLVISCQQLRLHRCGSCILYLRCSSRPIIEDCCGMQFAPFPESLVGGHFPLVSYLTEAVKNLPPLGVTMSESWAQVDDFGWLKAGHSPNWNILAPEDRRSADHWKRLLNATDGAVGDILQAFETTGGMTNMAPKDEPL